MDFLCLGDDKEPKREKAGGLDVRRLPIEHRRGGKFSYAYQYSAFILACTWILAVRSLRRRYALVYVNNMPDVLVFCSLIPKLLGAKVILDQHDPMPELMTTIFGLDRNSFSVRVMQLAGEVEHRMGGPGDHGQHRVQADLLAAELPPGKNRRHYERSGRRDFPVPGGAAGGAG